MRLSLEEEYKYETIFRNYEEQAFKRGLLFELPKEIFVKLTKLSCYYCGCPPNQLYLGIKAYNGVDRKDNSAGYFYSNCVSCCVTCNSLKGQLDYDKFIEQCKHIYNYLFLKKRTVPLPDLSSNDYYAPPHFACKGFGEANKYFIFDQYKRRAKKYKREFVLEINGNFTELTNSNCYYCGSKPSNRAELPRSYGAFIYNGIDRIDSNKGYIDGNMNPCCGKCNTMKSNLKSIIFATQVSKIANYRW